MITDFVDKHPFLGFLLFAVAVDATIAITLGLIGLVTILMS